MAPVSITRRVPVALLILVLCGACSRGNDVATLLADAHHYRSQGNFSAAIIQLKNVVQAEPAHAAARRLLGEMYLEQLDARAAEQEFRRAIALGDSSTGTALLLGQSLLLQGEYESVLDDVIARTAAAQALQAEAQLGLGHIDEAATFYARALKVAPDLAAAELGKVRLALAAGDPDAAQRLLAALLATNPDDREALRLQAQLLRQQGDTAGAAAVCETLLHIYPHDVRARILLATLMTDSGNFRQAHLAIDQARSIAPAAVSLLMAQAMLDYRERHYPAAARTLQRVLATLPDHYPAILLSATVDAARGVDGRAEQLLRQFLSAHPSHANATKLLATILLRRERPRDAHALLEPLLQADKNDIDLLSLTAEAALRTGHYAQADALFAQASSLRPQAPQLHTALAVSKLGNGDFTGAQRELEHALASPRGQTLLTMTYLRAKAYDQALQALAVMESAGASAHLHNLRAAVYLARQDLPAARASEERALALDPQFLPALKNLAQLDLIEQRPADAIRHMDSDNADSAFEQALQNEHWEDARKMALRVQGKNPASARGYRMEGEVHARAGEPAKAVAAFDAALQREADPATLRRIHSILMAAGKADEANARLAAWLLAHPHDDNTRRYLASSKPNAGGQ